MFQIEVSQNLVFFGAGASKPFGIPTMQEMVSSFEKSLRDNDKKLHDFYSKIQKILVKGYESSKIDIESMLSVINGISENTKPEQLGHFIFYYSSNNCSNDEFSSEDIDLATELKKMLQDHIKNKCTIKLSESKVKAVYDKSYVPFFKHTKARNGVYLGNEFSHGWKAYTTNYDNIFEDFWSTFSVPQDHFVKIGDSNVCRFQINPLNQEHTFAKLHGSLDWVKEVNSGQIIRKPSATGYTSSETKGNVMLFPIQQKDLYLHPWFSLFHDLKLGLLSKKTWYVIGYAFNDEFIKNAFEESLANDNSKKLVIINPNAEQIKDKFSKSRDQIDALPIKFGDDFFESQFKDYIRSTSRKN